MPISKNEALVIAYDVDVQEFLRFLGFKSSIETNFPSIEAAVEFYKRLHNLNDAEALAYCLRIAAAEGEEFACAQFGERK